MLRRNWVWWTSQISKCSSVFPNKCIMYVRYNSVGLKSWNSSKRKPTSHLITWAVLKLIEVCFVNSLYHILTHSHVDVHESFGSMNSSFILEDFTSWLSSKTQYWFHYLWCTNDSMVIVSKIKLSLPSLLVGNFCCSSSIMSFSWVCTFR